MRPFFAHSTKYDGSLHYRRPMQLVHQDAELLVLYCSPGNPSESYRGHQITRNHSLEYYWRSRPYNLIVMWHSDWRPRMHYVNIATPATWTDQQLHFIDLDLDLIWRAESDLVELDDQDEFELHRERFGYGADLVAQAWAAVREVQDLFASRTPPFDGSLHAWRPDGAA